MICYRSNETRHMIEKHILSCYMFVYFVCINHFMYSCYLKIKKKTYDKYILGLLNIFQKELERKLQKKFLTDGPY